MHLTQPVHIVMCAQSPFVRLACLQEILQHQTMNFLLNCVYVMWKLILFQTDKIPSETECLFQPIGPQL